jgi:hypothetical protein
MPRDRASNTLRQAQTLTLSANAKVLRDFVGNAGQNDLYSFKLGDRSSFKLDLTKIGKNANVDVELYQTKGRQAGVLRRIGKINFGDLTNSRIDKNLTRIARSIRKGQANETISRILEAGTYYLRVYPRKGNSSYELTLSVPGSISNSSVIAPDLSTWTRIGDVLATATPNPSVTITNARAGDDPPNVGNLNVSGVNPIEASSTSTSFTQSFAQAIGSTSDQLDQGIRTEPGQLLEYTEGSAVRNPAIAANAGDILRFNSNFLVKDPIDVGFVKIGSDLFRLSSDKSVFSYTFPTTGVYDIAIGVVDVNDFGSSSVLQITN